MKRDSSDLDKISAKLASCSPFSEDSSLRNIINGVVANANVNVHEFESVGKQIIDKMMGEPAFTFSFKRKDKAITLGDVTAINVAPDQVIDTALLFQRFLVVSKTGELSLEDVMGFELSSFPPALFEARNVLRKPDKPQLAHAIADHVSKTSNEVLAELIPTEQYVLDGGSLLHRVPWNKGESYGAIAKQYAEFTIRQYGLATVVFDGYGQGPSIKDNTHQRRVGSKVHPVVSFTSETEFIGKKEEFLSRDTNKQRFINLISAELRVRGCNVINSPGDADVDIALAAVSASDYHSTTLVGEDTDLLVLLLYYAKPGNKQLYFRSDKSTATTWYDINRIVATVGKNLCSQLLFVHAFTGCDSTSRIFGVGKRAIFHKFVKGDTLLNCSAAQFLIPNKKRKNIEDSGITAMSLVFGGTGGETLASLRHSMLTKKMISAKSFVTPERLPPTASSTKFHCLRVYYQMMVWMGKADHMEASKWGWNVEGDKLLPVMSDVDAAPEQLLKMIHCKCKAACATRRCSCRVYGLPCTPACGQCQLDACENPVNQTKSSDIEDEDDE